jgi:hypothetical protein
MDTILLMYEEVDSQEMDTIFALGRRLGTIRLQGMPEAFLPSLYVKKDSYKPRNLNY